MARHADAVEPGYLGVGEGPVGAGAGARDPGLALRGAGRVARVDPLEPVGRR